MPYRRAEFIQTEKFDEFVRASRLQAPYEELLGVLHIPEDEGDAASDPALVVIQKGLGRREGKRLTGRQIPRLASALRGKLEPFLHDREGARDASMLDLVTTGAVAEEEVISYLKALGIDVTKHEGLVYANKVFQEAIGYYDDEIGQGKFRHIRRELKKTDNIIGIVNIFKTAGGAGRKLLIPQACALLRIAAVINFMESDPKLSLLNDAERNLHAKLVDSGLIKQNDGEEGYIFDNGEPPIGLSNFELRTKTRNRIITKLLHKATNRTDEVLDHIGFRITTYSAVDTIRLLYAMFCHPTKKIFSPLYIHTGEVKNLVLNPEVLREALADSKRALRLVAQVSEDTIDHKELSAYDGVTQSQYSNRHSLPGYRSINITFDLPIVTEGGRSALFPIEIQLLDEETRRSNEECAPHGHYIRNQIKTVRQRVMGNNLIAAAIKRIAR